MISDGWLQLGANFSIVGTILIVVYFCALTVWRVSRLNLNLWPNWNFGEWSYRNPPEVYREEVNLPFVFNLSENSVQASHSFKFSLHCNSKDDTCSVKLVWGLNANRLLSLLNSPWVHFLSYLKDDVACVGAQGSTTNDPEFLHIETLELILEELNQDFTINHPKTLQWSQCVNQFRYPLVMFFLKNSERLETRSSCEVGALIVVLHVKSDCLPMPTSVLARYIKMKNGRVFNLKPLYVTTSDTNVEPRNPTFDNLQSRDSISPDGVICSVCHTFPATRALLPCGHVCLCAHCFEKVDKCPLCRSPLACFFKTGSESYVSEAECENEEISLPRIPRWKIWWQLFVNRFYS